MSDGKIRVNTTIDNSKAKKDLKDLENMTENTKKNIEKTTVILNSSGKPIKLIDVKTEAQLNKAKARMSEIRAEIQRAQKETDKMLSDAWTDEQATAVLEMEEIQLKTIREEYEELEKRVKAYEQAKAQAEQQKVDTNLTKSAGEDVKVSTDAAAYVSKIKDTEEYNRKLEETRYHLTAIEQASERAAAKTGVDVNKILSGNKEYTKLQARLNALEGAAGRFGGTSVSAFGAANKAANKVTGAIQKGIKKMTKYTFAIFGARSAFFFLKSVMSGYISENEELSNSIAGIKGALSEILAPAILRVVNLVKLAMAYISAFVKALTGVDIVARYNARALQKQASATKGLSKAQKENQSAAFDEQNKLSDPSAGGAGGGSVGGGSGELELPTLNEETLSKIERFASKLAEIRQWVADHKIEFAILAGIIAGCFAISEIQEFISCLTGAGDGLQGLLDKITLIAGIGAIFAGVFTAADALKEMKENGVSAGNVIKLFAGIVLTLVGVVLLLNASLLASPWTWLAIAIVAVIATIVLMITHIDEVNEAFKRVIEKIKEKLGVAKEWLQTHVTEPIKEKLKKPIETITEAVQKVFNKCKEIVNKIIEIVKTLKKVFSDTVIKPFKELLSKGWEKIKPHVEKIINSLKEKFQKFKDYVSELFKTVVSAIGDFFKGIVTGIVNSLFESIENKINSFIRKLNAAIGLINKIPGVSISKVTELELPRLARGGIVNNPGKGVPLIAGESGREAIIPLERNTEWMDDLASRISVGGEITIPIYLDSTLIATRVIKKQEQMAFATNGGVL